MTRRSSTDGAPRRQLAFAGMESPAPESDTDKCWTPLWLVNLIGEALGGIDTDPAWSDRCHVVPSALAYNGVNADGRTSPWVGRVFLNPPFSGPSRFVRRLVEHVETGRRYGGRRPEGLALVRLDPSTRWWAQLTRNRCATLLGLFRERVCFEGYGGGGSPDMNVALVHVLPPEYRHHIRRWYERDRLSEVFGDRVDWYRQ